MTPLRLTVLRRAADTSYLPGTAILFEANEQRMEQVRWLLAQKLVKFSADKTRIVATKKGRTELELQDLRKERRERVVALSLKYLEGVR